MRRTIVTATLLALCTGGVLLSAGSSRAEERGAVACFNQLKSLAGDWVTTTPSGKEFTILQYRVTAGGTAVEETEFPGTSHEMVTFFHLNGDRLVLTHYCHIGNQPHMQATAASTPTEMVFECAAGGGNLKSHDDKHMHAARYLFPDKDRIEAQWTMLDKGKAAGVAKFSARRKAKV